MEIRSAESAGIVYTEADYRNEFLRLKNTQTIRFQRISKQDAPVGIRSKCCHRSYLHEKLIQPNAIIHTLEAPVR